MRDFDTLLADLDQRERGLLKQQSLSVVLWRALTAVGLLIGGGLLLTLVLGPAMAQGPDPAVRTTIFDFGPIVAEIVGLVAPAVATLVSILVIWVLDRLRRWLGLKVDAGHRAAVEQGLDRAVGYVMERLQNRALGGIPLDCKSSAIVMAAAYARSRIPDALKHFGVSSRGLTEMVEARLEGLIIDPDVPQPEIRAARVASAANSF